MDERKKRHIEWSKKQEKKPSMKRRCDEHDYTQRGIYMITMATEGRLPLFGTLKGNPLAISGDDKPQVILSVLGERLKDCWKDIPTHYPEVSVIKLCIMPEHIHGVLFVKEKMPHHLGTIINGFKAENIRSKMILQVHDELNFSVFPEEKEKVEHIVLEEMQNAFQMAVPLVADSGFGDNWLEAH